MVIDRATLRKRKGLTKEVKEVSLDNQERLAEILNDSPRLISLAGTQYEVRALKMGTQWLIANEAIKINKTQSAKFGDIVDQFAKNIPAVVKVITLSILNDRNKIYKNGKEEEGYSELYESTYNTLMWDCEVSKFGEILVEVLQMLDIDFFLESCRILGMFRASTTARKTAMNEQK